MKNTAWPAVFTLHKFTYDAQPKLQHANAAFQADGILLSPDHELKSSILEIVKYKVHLSDAKFTEIQTHAYLKVLGPVPRYCAWKTSLKFHL